MTERRNIGQVLHEYGRIGLDEQVRALEFQRTNGGYFGEALVALGVITQEELEFGLAAQFDLPYVFPDPESIDVDAARLVSPEWALAHVALPIARGADSLSVVVDSPIKPDAVAELEARTGMTVDLAIASRSSIRTLILHAFGEPLEADPDSPIAVADAGDLLDRAIASRASQVGVSVRGRQVIGWWEAEGQRHHVRLLSGWPGAVERRVTPFALPSADAPPGGTAARVRWGGTELPATMHRISLPDGEEVVFEFPPPSEPQHGFAPPPSDTAAQVRLLVRTGVVRFLVSGEPEALCTEILPWIPALLFGPSVRTVHLVDAGPSTGSTMIVPQGGEERRAFFARLRSLQLDAITLDSRVRGLEDSSDLDRTARAIFLRSSIPEGGSPPPVGTGAGSGALGHDAGREEGFGWHIHVTGGSAEGEGGREFEWRLRPTTALREGRSSGPPPSSSTPSPTPSPSSPLPSSSAPPISG